MILDLHIHSKYSFDSLLSPKSIIEAAQDKGLNGVAITDHGTIKGGVEARSLNHAPDFLIIVGTEIATEAGDLVGLFLKEEIKERISSKVADEIHQQGGVVVLPHPYKGHRLSDELLEKVDLIEGFNARVSEVYNEKAVKLAKKWKKPVIAGSDAHFADEIGLARTIVEAKDEQRVKSALLNNRINITCNRTQRYWPFLSQMIGAIKRRDYRRGLIQLASMIKGLFIRKPAI